MIALVGLSAGVASADFSAKWDSVSGDSTDTVTVGGTTYRAGHLTFTYVGASGERGRGQYASGNFSGFCIELQFIAGHSTQSYSVNDIRNAPDPDNVRAYDQADENEVNAVLLAAISLDWINDDLSLKNADGHQLAAIQGWIWKVLFDDINDGVNNNTSTIWGNGQASVEMTNLFNVIDFNSSDRVHGLRAMLSPDTQDQLFVVPLPTAALAGLMTLGSLAGYSRLRRG